MTLDELKDNYARERGWNDWDDFIKTCVFGYQFNCLNEAIDEICILAQKEALKNASESGCDSIELYKSEYEKLESSIINENNLIK